MNSSHWARDAGKSKELVEVVAGWVDEVVVDWFDVVEVGLDLVEVVVVGLVDELGLVGD